MPKTLKLNALLMVAFAIGGLPMRSAQGCTTFAIPQSKEKIVAKSYDWHRGHGSTFVNLRGLAKQAVVLDPAETGAVWASKFGSLTFNQHGREFPLGGMNEKGLVVEIMWLASSRYPEADTRAVVNELQWIQYQLDNFSTTAEVVAAADKIRVARAYAKVHYMVCDAGGDCATFEYLKKKLVVHSGKELPVATLTNDPYAAVAALIPLYVGFGGTYAIPTSDDSPDRFVRATSLATAFDPKGKTPATEAAFDALQSIGGTDYTKFHIVYQPTELKLQYRTALQKEIKSVDLGEFDWQCDPAKDKTRIYDMNKAEKGDVTASFEAYTEAANLALVQEGVKDAAGALPPGLDATLAAYPSRLPCR